MKILPTIIVAGLACILPAIAAEPAKTLVSLSAKKHVLDSDSDLRGQRGSSKQKTLTLRVDVVNTSGKAVENAEISGNALVKRAGDISEKLVKEPLGTAKIPPLKPNGKVTIDLGKIELRELEWRVRKYEETLEGWKLTCTEAGVEIGTAVSDKNYDTLEKSAVQPPKHPGRKKKQAGQ